MRLNNLFVKIVAFKKAGIGTTSMTDHYYRYILKKLCGKTYFIQNHSKCSYLLLQKWS